MIKINIADDATYQLLIDDLRKSFNSSNVNLLFGAGFSAGVLSVLNNIEIKLVEAIKEGDKDKEEEIYKSFFNECILPLNNNERINCLDNERTTIIKCISDIISFRHSSILHKIFNVFTTNYDNLIERSLEKNGIDYFDGFSGRSQALFSTSNYGKLILKQSTIANRTTEIVTANLYKIHGSLTWSLDSDKLVFCDCNKQINVVEKSKNEGSFLSTYKKTFNIINPNDDKFKTTVLQSIYYDQIRLLSNELDKDNTLLIVQGFSFEDKHIRMIIDRALFNPTLKMFILAYSKDDVNRFEQYFFSSNIRIIYKNRVNEEDGSVSNKLELSDFCKMMEDIVNGIK